MCDWPRVTRRWPLSQDWPESQEFVVPGQIAWPERPKGGLSRSSHSPDVTLGSNPTREMSSYKIVKIRGHFRFFEAAYILRNPRHTYTPADTVSVRATHARGVRLSRVTGWPRARAPPRSRARARGRGRRSPPRRARCASRCTRRSSSACDASARSLSTKPNTTGTPGERTCTARPAAIEPVRRRPPPGALLGTDTRCTC